MRFYSIQETCVRTTLSRKTIERLITSGTLAATRAGRRVLIPEDALDQLLERGAVNAAAVELVRRSTTASNVPELLTDDATAERVAQLLRGAK